MQVFVEIEAGLGSNSRVHLCCAWWHEAAAALNHQTPCRYFSSGRPCFAGEARRFAHVWLEDVTKEQHGSSSKDIELVKVKEMQDVHCFAPL